MIFINLISVIKDININLKYLYSAILSRSIFKEVKRKLFKVALSYFTVL